MEFSFNKKNGITLKNLTLTPQEYWFDNGLYLAKSHWRPPFARCVPILPARQVALLLAHSKTWQKEGNSPSYKEEKGTY
jgi:hypothetical protein